MTLDIVLLSTVLALGKVCQHPQESRNLLLDTQNCPWSHVECIRSPMLGYISKTSYFMSQGHDGEALKYAQTYNFAALYHSQLGDLIESYRCLLTVEELLQTIMKRLVKFPE
ncbi:hypothetical protein CSPX01_01723 [Colletotrichum filicis]|nr:hypothetical protein CSPX01_01723 [Colletotrichum filicis]